MLMLEYNKDIFKELQDQIFLISFKYLIMVEGIILF